MNNKQLKSLHYQFNRIILTVALALWLVVAASAAPGDLDPTWGNNGVVTTVITNSFTNVENVDEFLFQLDGKILVVGNVVAGGVRIISFIARYNPDGTLDEGFGTGGKIVRAVIDSEYLFGGVDLQRDGKIVTTGYLRRSSLSSQVAVYRFNPDGTPDESFGENGRVTTSLGGVDEGNDVAVQPDGKIVVAAHSHLDSSSSNNSIFAFLRYNADGTLDETFGNGGITFVGSYGGHNFPLDIIVQPDGKILASGRAFNGLNLDFALVRVNSSGEPDASFGRGGILPLLTVNRNGVLNRIAVQADGKIVVVGLVQTATTAETTFVRYNSNGSLDASFGNDGIVFVPTDTGVHFGNDLALQPDGKIIGIGSYDKRRDLSNPPLIAPIGSFAAGRFNPDGSPDASFGVNGRVIIPIGDNEISFAGAGAVQPDGKILLGGNTRPAGALRSIAIVRLLGDSPAGQGTKQFDLDGNGK